LSIGLAKGGTWDILNTAYHRVLQSVSVHVYTIDKLGRTTADSVTALGLNVDDAVRQKADAVVEKLTALRLPQAAEIVRIGTVETLAYMSFPREHWTRLRTNNALERIMREIRRRTRVVGAFPDGRSALMLVAARLRHIAGTKWGTRRYLDMQRLREPAEELLTEATA